MQSKSNALYFIIGALVVVVAGLGYYVYQEKQQEHSVQLKLGKDGVAIEKN